MKDINDLGSLIIKFLDERQQLLRQQLKESEHLYNRQQEEKKLFIENSEKKFLQRMDEKRKYLDETSQKLLLQMEENRIKIEIKDGITNRLDQIDIKGLYDILSSVDVSLNPDLKDINNYLNKLETLIQEGGFTILERSGNTIKIDVK